MQKEYEITAKMTRAYWKGNRIQGLIFGDSKTRFNDGDFVRTSVVLEDLGNDIFRTKNSVYKVEFASRENRPKELSKIGGENIYQDAIYQGHVEFDKDGNPINPPVDFSLKRNYSAEELRDKRDEFAAQSLCGYRASINYSGIASKLVAEFSYHDADAMMKAGGYVN